MTTAEAIEYLNERVRVQTEEKTAYNRLRWTMPDIDAIRALMAAVGTAAEEPASEEPAPTRVVVGDGSLRPFVIELSAIVPCVDDTDAEDVGSVIVRALRQLRAGGHVATPQRRVIGRATEFTVANVDGDFFSDLVGGSDAAAV